VYSLPMRKFQTGLLLDEKVDGKGNEVGSFNGNGVSS